MFTTWHKRLGRGGRQRSLTLGSIEGAVVAGMFAFTELWLVHLVVARLGASDVAVGLLSTLPLAAMAAIGPFAGPLIRLLGGNRAALIWCCALQCLGLLALWPAVHCQEAAWAIPLAICAATLIGAVGAFGGPAWMSIMAQLVPDRLRGRYIGGRMRLFMFCKLLLTAGFAWLMHVLPPERTSLGLDLMLGIAVVSRLASTLLNARISDTPRPAPVASGSRLRSFLRTSRADLRLLRDGALGRWTLSWCLLMIGVQIAGPYFAPYLLRSEAEGGLAMGSVGYWGLLQTSQLTRLLILPAAGLLVDRVGALTTLRTALIGICLVPVLWGVSADPLVLVVTEVGSGIFWCLAECSIAALLFGCHPDPETRVRLVAWHQSITSVLMMAAGLAGAWILAILPAWTGSSYRDLFLLSALLRVPGALLALLLLPALGIWHRAGRARLRRVLAEMPPPITLHRGLLRFLRRPEG